MFPIRLMDYCKSNTTRFRLGRLLAVCSLFAGDVNAEPVDEQLTEVVELTTTDQILLEKLVSGLPPLSAGVTSERLGFHGPHLESADEVATVSLRLLEEAVVDTIALVPVQRPVGGETLENYGFPVRYRVEGRFDPRDRWSTLADQTTGDVVLTCLAPVVHSIEPVRLREIRVVVTVPWKRAPGLWTFALSEVMVLAGSTNVAVGATVTGRGVVSEPTWAPENLTDGQTSLGLPVTGEPSPSSGYHSQRANDPATLKWVEVDLGRSYPIDEIRLIPARPVDWPREGYGFPKRFRIEIRSEVNESLTTVFETGVNGYRNPGHNVATFPVSGVAGRYVRVTATELFTNSLDRQAAAGAVLALAEVEVYSGETNVAAGAEISALDSFHFDRRPLWDTQFLVDGFSSQSRLMPLDDWLRGLAERGQLEGSLRTLRRRAAEDWAAAMRRALTIAVILFTLLMIALVATLWRSRRRRVAQIAALRAQISRDLHDNLGSDLGSIQLLTDALLSNAQLSPELVDDVQEIRHVSVDAALAIRDIVWLVSEGNSTVGDLVDQIRSASRTFLATVDSTFYVEMDDPSRVLSLACRRNVLLAFKETMTNVARHAEATVVNVRVRSSATEFEFCVDDNGRGIAESHQQATGPAAGYGLANLAARADESGGRFELLSTDGGGASVTFAVPIEA